METITEPAQEVLKHSALFGSMHERDLKALISECSSVSWKKAEMIESDICSKYFHIIVSGRLKMTQTDPDSGKSIALFILKEGDVFDIFSLLDGKEHITFPIVLNRVEALRIPLERAREWLRNYTELNKAFLPYLGEKMRELEAFGESMAFKNTASRLAQLILRHVLPDEYPGQEHYPVKLIHDLSHESLAELIGSARSVVSTHMQKLKEEEVILSKRGHLAVKDLEKLIEKCDPLDYLEDKK